MGAAIQINKSVVVTFDYALQDNAGNEWVLGVVADVQTGYNDFKDEKGYSGPGQEPSAEIVQISQFGGTPKWVTYPVAQFPPFILSAIEAMAIEKANR